MPLITTISGYFKQFHPKMETVKNISHYNFLIDENIEQNSMLYLFHLFILKDL